MDERIAHASAAIEINTAHIPIDPIPHVDAAPLFTPTPTTCPYSTPIAATLWHATQQLATRGWCAGAMYGTDGALCLYGAIDLATTHGGHRRDAMRLLLEVIRRDFADSDSVPTWNDRHGTPALAHRYLDQATQLAHTRGL